MEIKVESNSIANVDAGAIVVNLFEGVTSPGGATGTVDRALSGAITALIADGEIKGKLGETTVIHTLGKMPAARVVVAGLGKSQDFDIDRVRRVSGTVCASLRKIGVSDVATIVHGAGIGGLEPRSAAQAMAEGAVLGLYRFDKYKADGDEKNDIETLRVVEFDGFQDSGHRSRPGHRRNACAGGQPLPRHGERACQRDDPCPDGRGRAGSRPGRRSGDGGARQERHGGAGDGRTPRSSAGLRCPAQADRHPVPGRPWRRLQRNRTRRQGHHLRLGRVGPQARGRYAADEARHVRRGRRYSGDGRHREARP